MTWQSVATDILYMPPRPTAMPPSTLDFVLPPEHPPFGRQAIRKNTVCLYECKVDRELRHQGDLLHGGRPSPAKRAPRTTSMLSRACRRKTTNCMSRNKGRTRDAPLRSCAVLGRRMVAASNTPYPLHPYGVRRSTVGERLMRRTSMLNTTCLNWPCCPKQAPSINPNRAIHQSLRGSQREHAFTTWCSHQGNRR